LIRALPLALTLALLGCGGGTLRVLPRGVTEVAAEIRIPAGTDDYEIRGDSGGSLLKMSDRFDGRALFVCAGARRIRFRHFTVDGNREKLEQRAGLPPSDVPFARFTRNNGILALGTDQLTVSDVKFRNIAGFAILVSGGRDVRMERVAVESSGSRDVAGRNNTSGGILLEEGVRWFRVQRLTLENIRGNGIWTHSLYTSPRGADGLISDNQFRTIGRDAVQVGHATRVVVERNRGDRIGYPEEIVDALPAALDTAGNVDKSLYAQNRFSHINGKCVDLDGFHDGAVRGNVCVDNGNYGIVMNNNNPDMRPEKIRIEDNLVQGAQYGGIFVMGTGHTIARNRLLDLNRAHRLEDLLRAGIFLGNSVVHWAPARANVVEQNRISGWGLKCVAAAPEVRMEENKIVDNTCSGVSR
jgi:Right handed beta helix region